MVMAYARRDVSAVDRLADAIIAQGGDDAFATFLQALAHWEDPVRAAAGLDASLARNHGQPVALLFRAWLDADRDVAVRRWTTALVIAPHLVDTSLARAVARRWGI